MYPITSFLTYYLINYHIFLQKSIGYRNNPGLFHELSTSIATFYTPVIPSLVAFLINSSYKKPQTISLSLYKTFFQRYSLYIVNTNWLCLETHTVPAGRHCHKSSPSFLSLYLSCLSRTLPGAGCCMQIF